MTPKKSVLLALAAAVLFVGPATAQRPPELPPHGEDSQGRKEGSAPGQSERPRPAPVQACPAWRWIGIKADPCLSCPVPKLRGWSVRPLFEDRATRLDPDPGQRRLPLGLRAFCLYEHAGSGGELTLAALPGLVALGRDCMAVLPAAPPVVVQRFSPELEARFLRQAGAVQAAPAGVTRVRLAVLDTAPTAEDPAANPNPNQVSAHGYSLANMAKKLACAGTNCAAQVTSQLALPRRNYDPASGAASAPDPVGGGVVGMIGDLAEAIRREVVAWQQPGRPPVLLLNLSLGWNRQFGGLEDDLATARPAVQAVQAALVDALCRGVTAMAAAGNRSWGPDPELSRGPLLPAAWEARPAPTPAACFAALSPGGPPALSGGSSYHPLVNAVGGVRAAGKALENGRLEAEPRLVAFGDHAIVADRSGAPTEMLTGSSVSTVVAATALAWVRHQLPRLDSFGAVDRLHQHGRNRGRLSSYCLGGKDSEPCPPAGRPAVHQIFVAQVARRACEDCEGTGCASSCPSGISVPDFEVIVPLRQRVATALRDARRIRRRDLRPANPPNRQFFDTNLQAETGPQPGSNPCTACTLDPGGGGSTATAYIEIDADFPGQLASPVLQAGGEAYAFESLAKGDRLVVEGLPPAPIDTVQLSFIVNNQSSVTSLFLQPD